MKHCQIHTSVRIVGGPHPSTDELELLVLKRLSEPSLACVEEHLLICEACLIRLADAELYIRALQRALDAIW